MKNISTQDTDTWLNLLCRFSTEYNLSFIPSPEEMSIIVRSQESWAGVARYDPTPVEFHVVSDSTLVWSKKNRAGFLKSYKWGSLIHSASGCSGSGLHPNARWHCESGRAADIVVEPQRP